MNASEIRATLSLSGVYALRMFGMFLILPVFAVYAAGLPGATPVLAGLALGVYGLTQGTLQIPLGWLSDRLGRKPVIAAGLALFALGSGGAAVAPDIHWTVAARALQGTGAVGAATAALLADLTRDSIRTRAMAVVGVTIGSAFALSLILGPVLDALVGVRGIFWLTGVLAVVSIGVVWKVVPDTVAAAQRRHATIKDVYRRHGTRACARSLAPRLVRHHAGIFILHAILTASFVAVPALLVEAFGMDSAVQWRLYLPVLAASVLLMLPFVLLADRPAWRGPVVPAAVALLVLSMLVLAAGHGRFAVAVAGLVLFFTAFNFLEAALPARVSQLAPDGARGAVLGVHSSSQFLGTFAGGTAGGAAWGLGGPAAVFGLCALMALAWLALVSRDARDARA